jgi:hypothetical protein
LLAVKDQACQPFTDSVRSMFSPLPLTLDGSVGVATCSFWICEDGDQGAEAESSEAPMISDDRMNNLSSREFFFVGVLSPFASHLSLQSSSIRGFRRRCPYFIRKGKCFPVIGSVKSHLFIMRFSRANILSDFSRGPSSFRCENLNK